jgi:hypothetical protein
LDGARAYSDANGELHMMEELFARMPANIPVMRMFRCCGRRLPGLAMITWRYGPTTWQAYIAGTLPVNRFS